MIEGDPPTISVRRQWTLLGLPRSRRYSQPRGASAEPLHLMRLLETQYTATPFAGMRRMTAWLRTPGDQVHHKRGARLMQQRGIAAISTTPHLRQATAGQVMYPSLFRGVKVARITHVWSTDSTSIRLPQGFVSLVAVRDWCSRSVLRWALSGTLDGQCCREALPQALRHGSRPEMFNTDQGGQFTRSDCTSLLQHEGMQISMDGRGRALDNVFVERLWRTVKYAEVSCKDSTTVRAARQGLGQYLTFYNHERLPQALGSQTPAAVYS